MKGKKKYQKGITLIALVITIIVLLILAGVTLSIVFNGGIINKSKTAVDKYSEESAKEKLSLAIFNYKMGVITGEAGEGEGQKTFAKYIEEIGGEANHNEAEKTYTVKLDGYEFIVYEKEIEVTTSYKSYNIGDTVAVGGEQFYVLEDSDETVTLIAKYNLGNSKVDGKWKQAPNSQGETVCAFSSTDYWSDNDSSEYSDLNNLGEESEGDAIAKAKEYAKTVTGDNTNNTGRLLIKGEADALKTLASSNSNVAKMLWGKENIHGVYKNLKYYLGSARDGTRVWFADGRQEYIDWGYYWTDQSIGVRPVITVSKSLVS